MSAGWFDNASCLQQNQFPYKMMMNEDLPPKNQLLKQGIVSILNSDFNKTLPHNSIRRTLSAADMSSQKCLTSSLKRVQSSLHLQALGEEHHRHDHNDHHHDDNNKSGQAFEEIWTSILSPTKTDGSGSDSAKLPPPYVHPLAKRTASSLSEKSLEICTESLGSETGSDGFSYPPSEPEDSDKEQEEEVQEQQQEVEVEVEVEVSNYKCNNNLRGPTIKRSMMVPPVRPSFPPPLPSLAHRDDGSNLHILSHRQDGRLVVEAVSVPSQNCFRVQRQDGRLLLTMSSGDQQHEQEEDQDEVFNDDEASVEEENVLAIPRGVINVQSSCTAFTMSKLMELTNTRNKSTWPPNCNTTIIKTLNDNEEEVDVTMAPSLPPPPTVSTATAAAVALNAYEYYWRWSNNPAAAAVAVLNPLVGQPNNNKICAPQVERDTKGNNNKLLYASHNRKGVALAQEEVVLVKAAGRVEANTGENAEYLVPLMLRGCKEPKRSLLFWEPYCIATS